MVTHSPGYAFDGFPIYGPLGYNKSDENYNDLDKESLRTVKFLRSSYDSNNIYNPVTTGGDLDFCMVYFLKHLNFHKEYIITYVQLI